MNFIIKEDAEAFCKTNIERSHEPPTIFTDKFHPILVRALSKYYQVNDKIEFLHHLQYSAKNAYDEHLEDCNNLKECHFNKRYEIALHFLEQEKELQLKIQQSKAKLSDYNTYIENLHVTGPQSIVNTGTIQSSIITNSQKLEAAGEGDVSASILELAQAIADLKELDEERKAEHLDNLEFLSLQAAMPKEERVKKSVLKSVITNMLTALNAISSISTVAGVTLKDITRHLLESGFNA